MLKHKFAAKPSVKIPTTEKALESPLYAKGQLSRLSLVSLEKKQPTRCYVTEVSKLKCFQTDRQKLTVHCVFHHETPNEICKTKEGSAKIKYDSSLLCGTAGKRILWMEKSAWVYRKPV